MRTLVGAPLRALLDQPVFDSEGQLLGYVRAVGSRHGHLRRIGIESPGSEPGPLRFVTRERFAVEPDRIVLIP